jgi:hypothetical protein
MRRPLLLLVVLAVPVLALSGSAVARDAMIAGLHVDKCPTATEARAVDSSHYVQLAEAAAGVERRVAKVFRSVPAAGNPFAFQMNSGYRMGIGSQYFAEASKVCGVTVAQNSWAFSISLPTTLNASQASYMAFAARAHGGWRLYGGAQLN